MSFDLVVSYIVYWGLLYGIEDGICKFWIKYVL